MADEHHAIVQYFEWLMGEPKTLEIVPISRMVAQKIGERTEGYWQFYLSAEQMNDWYHTHHKT